MADSTIASLFGASPWEVQQQQNANLANRAQNYAQMQPLQRATADIYEGAGMLGGAVAPAFGMQNPAVQQAQRSDMAMAQGGDIGTAKGLLEKADQFRKMGDFRTATALMLKGKEMEREEAKAALALRKQDFQENEAFKLKKQQAEQTYELAKQRAEDTRLSAVERNAAAREANQIRLQIAQLVKTGGGVNKPPAGYRWTPNGDLELIPGGPADQKATAAEAQRAIGSEGLNSTLATLRDAYARLEAGGGITSTERSGLSNLGASTSSSAVGQLAGRMFGTKNQSARNDIAMARPALLAALMKATGMSSKQIDSNAELKLWLATATDPTLDVEANKRALSSIEARYLSGAQAKPDSPSDTKPPKTRIKFDAQGNPI